MEGSIVRMRHAAPATVLLVVVVVFLVMLRVGAFDNPIPRITLGAAAFCWFVIGIALRARTWRVVDTPISKTCAAAIGEGEFQGRANSPTPQNAPGSGIPCAWYRWKLQHYVHSGKSSHWETVEHNEYEHGFWVTDDTGSIWVVPANADMDGFDCDTLPVLDRSGRWRQLEWRLPDKGAAYVLGPVVQAPTGQLMIACDHDSDSDFLISEDSKKQVAQRLGRWAWLSLILAAIALVIVPLLTSTQSLNSNGEQQSWPALHGSIRLATILFVAYLLVLGLSWLVRVYNRLVIVQTQAEKAWASIEVQLQRRHDLIENLVTVVQKYAQYERQTQTDIAATRAQGILPTDAEVQAATATDTGARAEGAKLVALAESYPQLKADQEFAKLSATLTDTENRIAYSRQFYNEAVNIMRDRRGTLPYAILAPLVKVPSLKLFGEGPPPPAVVPVPTTPVTAAAGSDTRTSV
jgi:LemA protein